jgi:hypothetical protein
VRAAVSGADQVIQIGGADQVIQIGGADAGLSHDFGEWLTRYRVDDMDKSDRAKLLQLMEERPAIEEWRATLPDYTRRSLNHPVIVWRKWTAATRVRKSRARNAPGVTPIGHARLQEQIEQQQARIAELEEELTEAREHVCPHCGKPRSL